MTVSLQIGDLNDIVFPPWFTAKGFDPLRKLRTETWRQYASWRVDVTRDSPLAFAITYLAHRLRHPETGVISFNRMHLEMCNCARRWTTPGAQLCSFVGPRGFGKTTWPFGILPLWALAHGHRSNFVAFAYTAEQARKHLKNILHDLRTNELLLHDFPDLAPRRGSASIDRTVLLNGATLAVYGMTGSSRGFQDAQGRRPELMVGDDLEPSATENSLDEVERNKSRLLRGILPMGSGRSVVWVTGTTPMHDCFIHGFVHAAKRRPAGEWVHRMGFQPYYYPALDENDESTWPENWPTEMLRALRAGDPYGFELEYQNDPTPPKDMTFWTADDFRYQPNFRTADRVLYIDPAETVGPKSDYTAMVLLGRDITHRMACVEKVAWGRWTDPEISLRIDDFCRDAGRPLPLVRAEGNPTKLDSWAPWPEGVDYGVIKHSTPKVSRIRRAHSLYRQRKVVHRDQFPNFERKLCEWGRSKHDDVPDALAGALEWAFPVPE